MKVEHDIYCETLTDERLVTLVVLWHNEDMSKHDPKILILSVLSIPLVQYLISLASDSASGRCLTLSWNEPTWNSNLITVIKRMTLHEPEPTSVVSPCFFLPPHSPSSDLSTHSYVYWLHQAPCAVHWRGRNPLQGLGAPVALNDVLAHSARSSQIGSVVISLYQLDEISESRE